MLFAAQEQALLNQFNQSKDTQTITFSQIMHLPSGFPNVTQKQYKIRHDNVAIRVHCELCKKHGLESSERWYKHTPADIMENYEV